MADHEQTLRRLAVNDDSVVASILAQRDPAAGITCQDARTLALVRLAALIASTGTAGSYQSAVDSALAVGTPIEDIVGVLIAIAPTIGSARLVAAAPLLARAAGYDVDAAFDDDRLETETRFPGAALTSPQDPVRPSRRSDQNRT